MAILPNPRDSPEQVLARSAQEDPWVMYLVVHQSPKVTLHHVLIAAAQATLHCVASHADRDPWREPFARWAERSFRKVSLRAKDKAWEKLSAYDHGEGRINTLALVRALPPITKNTRDSFIKNLQVYSPSPESFEAPSPQSPPDPDAMVLVINPKALMSPGKTVAQVAHAVLLCAWSELPRDPRYREHFTRWTAKGFPIAFAPSALWETLRRESDGVVVRDAGLTEVPAGTETVLALCPGTPCANYSP